METTYEKASETELKVIKSVEEVISLSDIKKDLEGALSARERLIKDHNERLSELDSYIQELQLKVSEAGKLNIKEVKAESIESIESIEKSI